MVTAEATTAVAGLALGLGAGVGMLAILLQSILWPARRLWPPKSYSVRTAVVVWGLTLAVFASTVWLGVLGWQTLAVPDVVRWGVGLPLIVLANGVVWREVWRFGLAATSGAEDRLYVDGFYRYSRNPQYGADIVMLIGWALLSASQFALPVIVLGSVLLLLAPLAEESWLEEKYGEPYRRYRQQVRRFI